jgi:osmotically-inducible protein OsmY
MTHASHSISDEDLYKSILALFATDQRSASANLRVGVLNGIVHLAGVVASLETRIAAAELAGRLPGVRGVVNRIEAPGAPSPARTVNLDLKSK